MGVSWVQLASHRAWLAAEADRIVDFAQRSAHPDGGFAWQSDDGSPQLDRPVELWITTRMVHVLGLAHLWGRPGLGALIDGGVAALAGRFHDAEQGGWFSSVDLDGPVLADKRAYEHSFVVLAASTALHAGRRGAADLLTEALAVQERHFWSEDDGLVVDVWNRDWTDCEPYRGVNANMHTVEAYLAAADAGADPVWRRRALRITERVIHGWARSNGWRIPEHFDQHWQPVPEYNADDPGHPFRPYGATIGHALEWSRLCLHVHACLSAVPGGNAPDWLIDDAVALFDAATRDGWAVDGADGFVYTTGWDGTPVVRQRLFWVLGEGIAAAAALAAATGNARFEKPYRSWWDYAERHFIDRQLGNWRHELDPQNEPAATIWQGKPDSYHALQTALLPRAPLAPTLAAALARGQLS
jgi:sulfoquinovose isomerase